MERDNSKQSTKTGSSDSLEQEPELKALQELIQSDKIKLDRLLEYLKPEQDELDNWVAAEKAKTDRLLEPVIAKINAEVDAARKDTREQLIKDMRRT